MTSETLDLHYIRHTRSSNNPNTKYVVPKSKTTTYQRSFLVRVTRTWNILADEFEICMDNLNSFKSVINKYYYTSLATTYDPDNPRTLKTICCKCNTPRSLSLIIFRTCKFTILSSGPAVIGYAVVVTLPSLLFFDSLFSFIVIYVNVTTKLIK